MLSALGSPGINRWRALRTTECVKEKEANPLHVCLCVYVCVEALSYVPLSIRAWLTCMPRARVCGSSL